MSKRCPKCGVELCEVVYLGGPRHKALRKDGKAGDWYCERCPDNGRSEMGGLCYYWDREVHTDEAVFDAYCLDCGVNDKREHKLNGWTTAFCPTCNGHTSHHENPDLVLKRAENRLRRGAAAVTMLKGLKPSVAERLAYWEPTDGGIGNGK